MFLNNSRAEVAEDCLRMHFWQQEFNGRGLQSNWRNDNLDFGTIVHAGLAHFYAGEPLFKDKAREFAKEFLDFDNLYFEDRNKWAEHFDWIDRILSAYQPWAEQNDDFTVIQLESEGCVVLGEICYLCGKPYPEQDEADPLLLCPRCEIEVHQWVYRVDAAVMKGEDHPKLNIIDHKTTSSLGENYLLSWHNSLQLWGYCYGYEKQSDLDVGGYTVNIIRKLKGIGNGAGPHRTCPECRNGVKKRLGCINCQGTGKVEKEAKEEIPFVREQEAWDEQKKEIFVRQRINTANRILEERKRAKRHPDEAWPMNPKSCFKMGRCPYWKLCYTPNDPEKWYLPTDEQLTNFTEREADYVAVRQLASEEMV